MPFNPTLLTSFLFHDGVMSIRTIGPYTQWGFHDSRAADIAGRANDHSCLKNKGWAGFLDNWSFCCVRASGGSAFAI